MKSIYDTLHVKDPEKPTVDPLESMVKLTGKSFSRAVVESTQYRESIVRRLRSDTLPAAVECKLLDHAYGVPKQRVEVEDKTNSLENATPQQLQERLLLLNQMLEQLRTNETPDKDGKGASVDRSVH